MQECACRTCVCVWVGAHMLMYICGCVWEEAVAVRVCTCTCLHMGELWIHPLVVDAHAVPYTAAPLAFVV